MDAILWLGFVLTQLCLAIWAARTVWVDYYQTMEDYRREDD